MAGRRPCCGSGAGGGVPTAGASPRARASWAAQSGAAAALARSRARWLVVPAPGDRIFPIAYNRDLAEALRKAGRPVEVVDLEGGLGHLEGVAAMAKAEAQIRAFLAP